MTRRGGVIAGENSPAITLFFSGPAQKCAPGPLKKSQPSDAPTVHRMVPPRRARAKYPVYLIKKSKKWFDNRGIRCIVIKCTRSILRKNGTEVFRNESTNQPKKSKKNDEKRNSKRTGPEELRR